jgi:hypothetical protein
VHWESTRESESGSWLPDPSCLFECAWQPLMRYHRTWTNDPALACLSVGQARLLSLDRVLVRRQHDDWREWIYISIMDKLCVPCDTGPLNGLSNDDEQVPGRRL